MLAAIIWGIIGGFLGSSLFYYMLFNVVAESDRDSAIQKLPFTSVKIILFLTVLHTFAILELLILATIASFAYRCIIDLRNIDEFNKTISELEIIWKKINSEDDEWFIF